MKVIPYFLILVGGIMIYAGINKDNPLTVFKNVIQGKDPSMTENKEAQNITDAAIAQAKANNTFVDIARATQKAAN